MAAALPASGQSFLSSMGDSAEVSFLRGWRQADGTHIGAIAIRLDDGWHTYWRIPGESGVPPRFDWSGSHNLASVAYEWPHPSIHDTFGMVWFGYEHELILPVRLRPENPGQPIEVSLDMTYGVCKEICKQMEADVSASLLPGALPEGRAQIEASLGRRTRRAEEAGVAAAHCTLAPNGDAFDIVTEVTFADALAPDQVAVVETDDPNLWIAVPDSQTQGARVTSRARVDGMRKGHILDRSGVRITVLDQTRSVQVDGCNGAG